MKRGQDLEHQVAHPHQEFPRVPPRAHNGLKSSEKADKKSPHYVFLIKDRAFSEAKHSATRNMGRKFKGRSEILKRDKYYKHRLYMMCVIQNYNNFWSKHRIYREEKLLRHVAMVV